MSAMTVGGRWLGLISTRRYAPLDFHHFSKLNNYRHIYPVAGLFSISTFANKYYHRNMLKLSHPYC